MGGGRALFVDFVALFACVNGRPTARCSCSRVQALLHPFEQDRQPSRAVLLSLWARSFVTSRPTAATWPAGRILSRDAYMRLPDDYSLYSTGVRVQVVLAYISLQA